MKKMIFPVIILFVSLSACKSVDYTSSEQIIHKVADVTITMTPLSKEHLIALYGKEENPFINYPSKLPRKTFLVFDTEIKTESTVIELSRRTMDTQIGEEVTRGSNSVSLIQAWNPYFNSDSEELHIKNKINKILDSDDITVAPDSPFKGLLVYLIPISDATDAVMHIPAKVPGGDEGIIKIPFKVVKYVDGEKEVPTENTGIFAE